MKKSEKKTRRSRLDAASWSGLLSAHKESGLSVKAFCAAQGISAASYYRWQKLENTEVSQGFSPIELERPTFCGLVVELPGGISMRFSELPPVEYLRKLSSSFSGQSI